MKQTFVLGAARWHMSQVSTYRKLIAQLRNEKYRLLVDTSILYGDSENVISHVITNKEDAIVNTKFGDLGTSKIDANSIYTQFRKSKSNLRNLKINTYFLHSLDPNRLTDSAVEVLLELKRDTEIQTIGFSGDNDYLRNAIRLNIFDRFMFSFNPLDMSNLEIAHGLNPESIFIKRVIASGALKYRRYKLWRRGFARIIGEPWAFRDHDYQYRLQRLNKYLDKPLSLQDFVTFSAGFFPGSGRVFGLSSQKHLRQILSADVSLSVERQQELHLSWLKCRKNSWHAIV